MHGVITQRLRWLPNILGTAACTAYMSQKVTTATLLFPRHIYEMSK